jgi:hypothetical protein
MFVQLISQRLTHLILPSLLIALQASSAATADDPTIDLSQLDVAAVMLLQRFSQCPTHLMQSILSLLAALQASSAATADNPTIDLSQLDVAAVMFSQLLSQFLTHLLQYFSAGQQRSHSRRPRHRPIAAGRCCCHV